MSYEYQKQLIDTITAELLAEGFRVFIAESGTHGVYTDSAGQRVVSFQADTGEVRFSGNYKSQRRGTGWRLDTANYDAMLAALPPRWATQDEQVRVTTLAQHMATYQNSSKYQERIP